MNTRYSCPSCQHRNKTFSLYIDTETGEHIHTIVGRCNRENNCGHHYTPMQYFKDNNIPLNKPIAYKHRHVSHPPKPATFIPIEVFKSSLKDYETNQFVKYLISLFDEDVTVRLISRYYLGSSSHWNGATVFWQIDVKGNVRTGKIMLYSPTTGKRVKNLELPVYWVHKALKQPEFELRQCLFGEHLLIDKTKPVAIVESEKTAVIASVYLPQFIWVAVGSLTNLNAEKCSILLGRNVILFPDLNGFEKWSSKAKEFSHLAILAVSDLLERKATDEERKKGLDIADYLIKFNYKSFVLPETDTIKPAIQPLQAVKDIEQPKPERWLTEFIDLITYFEGISPPPTPIKLNECMTITDVSKFIDTNIRTAWYYEGNSITHLCLNRLAELKHYIENNNDLQ